MLVVINGIEMQIPESATVRALIVSKKLKPESVLVCINDEVIPRGSWENLTLRADDRIDVVRIVGGG